MLADAVMVRPCCKSYVQRSLFRFPNGQFHMRLRSSLATLSLSLSTSLGLSQSLNALRSVEVSIVGPAVFSCFLSFPITFFKLMTRPNVFGTELQLFSTDQAYVLILTRLSHCQFPPGFSSLLLVAYLQNKPTTQTSFGHFLRKI